MPQESLLANDDHKLPNLFDAEPRYEGAMVVILSIQRAVADLSLLRWGCNNLIRFCSSLAKMSPQNCLAILSPPSIRSSPQKRRRSDERMGAQGEPERNPSDACGAVDHGWAGNCGRRSQAFGDLCTSDEEAAAQDEGARSRGIVAWQPKQSAVEQNGIREDKASS